MPEFTQKSERFGRLIDFAHDMYEMLKDCDVYLEDSECMGMLPRSTLHLRIIRLLSRIDETKEEA